MVKPPTHPPLSFIFAHHDSHNALPSLSTSQLPLLPYHLCLCVGKLLKEKYGATASQLMECLTDITLVVQPKVASLRQNIRAKFRRTSSGKSSDAHTGEDGLQEALTRSDWNIVTVSVITVGC